MQISSVVYTSLFMLQNSFISVLVHFCGLRKLHGAIFFFVHQIVKAYLAFGLHKDLVGKFSLLNTCFSWGTLQSSIGFLVVLSIFSTLPKPVIVLNLVEIWKFSAICKNCRQNSSAGKADV